MLITRNHQLTYARLLLQLLEEKRFPRIWAPDKARRDLRQLLMHRRKLVTMRRAS